MAVVGCGAVAERVHLPCLSEYPHATASLLVDRDLSRAKELAEKFDVPDVSDSLDIVPQRADAAIVSVPHRLHSSVSLQLLKRRVHVLVEKPMAFTVEECDEMIRAAAESDVVLAVGLMRHFKWSVQFTREAIRKRLLGSISHVDAEEGREFNWPLASNSAFSRAESGGGVLADTGAHTVDVVLTLFGEAEKIEYFDDNVSGVESDGEIRLRWPAGIEGVIKLSRVRPLRNTVVMHGERGTLEMGLDDNSLRLCLEGVANPVFLGDAVDQSASIEVQGYLELFPPQLSDWIAAIRDSRPPVVPGAVGRKSVAVIQQCYQQRQDLAQPWECWQSSAAANSAIDALKDKRVLITGATGFIGGRLAEILVRNGVATRAFYRNHARLSRLARFGEIELFHGEFAEASDVAEATRDVDVVLHLAHDFAPLGSSQQAHAKMMLERLVDCCEQNKVSRLVYASTISVYGDVMSETIDEELTKKPPYEYGKAKLAAQNYLLEHSDKTDVEVIVLQPTIVYGPFSKPWTIAPARQMQKQLIAVPNSGRGRCNAVYVDDVVQAFLLAATTTNREALGKEFLVSGPEPITWTEFFRLFEEVLGVEGIYECKLDDLSRPASIPQSKKAGVVNLTKVLLKNPEFWLLVNESPWAHRVANVIERYCVSDFKSRLAGFVLSPRKAVPDDQAASKDVAIPNRERANLIASTARVSIERAKDALGYQPEYPFAKGSRPTAEFLRWYFSLPTRG